MNLDSNQKVIVQGITGSESSFWVNKMVEYGTNIVAGTSPGKGGQEVEGIPVYDTVSEAVNNHQIDTSILFVPPRFARAAASEAIEAGIKQLIILADGVPVHDTMYLINLANLYGATIFGPNTPGMVFPGRSSLGIMPCWLEHVFKPGRVAVLSRSGSLGNEISYQVTRSGLGIACFIGIGGDALIGTTFIELLEELDGDEDVEGIVIVGELGGNMEETAAEYVSRMNTPVFAFIAGKTAPVGVPMGHAGALIEGASGTSTNKIKVLKENGVLVADTPDGLPDLLKLVLEG
jgi:succinyl-CoA synthetase alpha subunit